jgi:hypothetical protein
MPNWLARRARTYALQGLADELYEQHDQEVHSNWFSPAEDRGQVSLLLMVHETFFTFGVHPTGLSGSQLFQSQHQVCGGHVEIESVTGMPN